MITLAQLQKFAPNVTSNNLNSLLDSINACIIRFNLNTKRRLNYFLTHTSFETMGYTKWSEDLYYTTPDRLCVVWPSKFTMNLADRETINLPNYAPDYVKNSEKLASCVYANKYGNGNEQSNDGFTFRGQGGLHMTFKDNYAACSKYLFTDNRLVVEPLLVQDVAVAMLTAGWFWDIRKLNELADSDSFTQVTQVINGSTATVPERLKVLNVANSIF